ncbi:hypothetical protein MY10362_008994 [Beauveria mimosiformis]
MTAPINVLMIGTGEYTTGFVGTGGSASDKKVGVVGLTLFDLRRRGKVGKLGMVGVNGTKFPAIREHLEKNITQVYNGLDTSFDSFPANDQKDPDAYKAAIDGLKPGDAITIFTPDPTHFPIALYAIERGIHVLITKPAVKLLEHHQELIRRADERGVYVFIEHHKRFDPAYSDARFKAKTLGDFNYWYSYMSQPKFQLDTFKSWAGKESDISYYLNSHHVDICDSMVQDRYVPVKVSASSSKGVAVARGCVDETEDTISVLVTWAKKDDASKRAVGVYTSSWTAPERAGVHTNQYFHYLAADGEIRVDQAHRGYDIADDKAGQLQWLNPFYMRYAPDEDGNFNGQTGYGYISLEKFVDGCRAVNEGRLKPADLDAKGLPTLRNTIATTAILHAGRKSIDESREIGILIEDGSRTPSRVHLLVSMASPASEPDAASSPRPVGIHHSDILFSNDQQMSMSALMSGLRRTTLTMHNRLRSIRADAEFVARAASAFGGPREAEAEDAAPCNARRPLIANERCGSWYVRPENKGGSAYFKSTDGHERAWKFSTRRLNLHIVELAEKHDGVIIVDSTRRGKRMPDALSTTIPVWCAVLNRVLLPQHPLSKKLFLPPSLPPSTHAQIAALLPGFVASLEALTLPLPRGLSKPLRPLWITQDSVLPGEEDGEDKGGSSSSSSSVIFEDYRPVICCTASRRVVGSEMEEGGYIQGAGDDTENWAHGLTPPVFWAHVDRLLETAEADLPALIKQLVEEDAATHAATGSEARTQLAPGIYVCPTSAATCPRGEESSECHIQLLPSTSPQESWVKTPRLMQVGLGNSKAGSRNLRLALPHICAFAREYMRGGGGNNNEKIIIVSCDSGKDFSVGTALALSCLLLDDAGSPREEGGGGAARVGGFTKTLVKSRLGGFMTAFPAANPSRATLQSVNSFLMDWRN